MNIKYVETSPEEIIEKWIKIGNPRRVLDLSSYIMDELPDIPDEVESLNIRNCGLKELRKLPKNLKWLDCAESDLQSIQLPLPESLRYINCRWCYDLEPFDIPHHIRAKTHFTELLKERKRTVELATQNAAYFVEKWIREGKPNKVLDLSSMNLTELPPLPDTVRYLNCRNNPIKVLSNLPLSLRKLNCAETHITHFQNMPTNLHCIDCSVTVLISLDGLPDSVRYIDASDCEELRKIYKLPSELRRLCLSGSQVERLANIPKKVEYININRTQIERVPFLPESLKYLYCNLSSKLKYLTNIPVNLEVLDIATYKMFSLPQLPDTLRSLNIDSISILNNNSLPNSIEILKSRELHLNAGSYIFYRFEPC